MSTSSWTEGESAKRKKSAQPHREDVILTSRLYITFVPGTIFHPITTPTCPSARRMCIPSLIWPTDKEPCSCVKKGCFWLVCTTTLVFHDAVANVKLAYCRGDRKGRPARLVNRKEAPPCAETQPGCYIWPHEYNENREVHHIHRTNS